ncbi:MAG: hypothetical protein KDC53_15410 [Saprospiraceae bacterium]|nr:hypothetical protein [Saprospiraceae bacterium]
MKASTVLRKLREGSLVNCFKVNLTDPRVAEIVSLVGFDCVWVDMEHIGQDWSAIAAQVWATKTQNTDIMIRVSRGSYSDYVRPLELDATGIIVPHIMGLQDAREVVQYTRFHPLGRRPVDGGNGDGLYTMMNFDEYIEQSNREKFVVLQIEDPEPLAELEAIADLPGYDMLFFGPADFSQGIGALGKWDDPRIMEARRTVVDTALKYGKFAGTVGTPENIRDLQSMGYQFVSMGADVIGLAQYCKKVLAAYPK